MNRFLFHHCGWNVKVGAEYNLELQNGQLPCRDSTGLFFFCVNISWHTQTCPLGSLWSISNPNGGNGKPAGWKEPCLSCFLFGLYPNIFSTISLVTHGFETSSNIG